MRVYQIVAETYESKPYPVVVHTFVGASPEEAEGYPKAHLGADSFFRGCTRNGRFRALSGETVVRARGWGRGRRGR